MPEGLTFEATIGGIPYLVRYHVSRHTDRPGDRGVLHTDGAYVYREGGIEEEWEGWPEEDQRELMRLVSEDFADWRREVMP
jgi:hypothetical protein